MELLPTVVTKTKDNSGRVKTKIQFPTGCDECSSTNEWDCTNNCLWPENYWKYDEMKYLLYFATLSNAGLDLNQIDAFLIEPELFIKIDQIKRLI